MKYSHVTSQYGASVCSIHTKIMTVNDVYYETCHTDLAASIYTFSFEESRVCLNVARMLYFVASSDFYILSLLIDIFAIADKPATAHAGMPACRQLRCVKLDKV